MTFFLWKQYLLLLLLFLWKKQIPHFGFLFSLFRNSGGGAFLSSSSTHTGTKGRCFFAASTQVSLPVPPNSHWALGKEFLKALPTPLVQMNGDTDTHNNFFRWQTARIFFKTSLFSSLGCSHRLWRGRWGASSSTSAWCSCDLFCFLSWCHNSSLLWVVLALSHRRWQNKGCPCHTTSKQDWSLLCRRCAISTPILLFCSLSRADLGTNNLLPNTSSLHSLFHSLHTFSLSFAWIFFPFSSLHFTPTAHPPTQQIRGGELTGEEKGFYR